MPAAPHSTRSPRAAVRVAGALLVAVLALRPGGAAAGDACSSQSLRANAAIRHDYPDEALASYGVWVKVARYGAAWKPCDIDPDWRPYFHGSWSWTERGWFWVSQEPWGPLTYHYGRWLFEGAEGWVWLPGKTWAPAWVMWRWNDEVVGWAPLEPGGNGYSAFWTFVPAARLAGEKVEAVAVPGPRVPALLLKTRRPPAATGDRGAWVSAEPRLSRR